MSDEILQITDEEALEFHTRGKPGKIEVVPTKPLTTQRDLSLAYSPGVAVPCLAIAEDPDLAYDYTAKGNLVAVISNGTAVLGLGDLGALGSKPVMEGKAVLFKRFADVDGIDLEVDTKDVDEFVNAVRYLGPSFGGINLEDIKAPECFIIEQRLRELMPIPVFHDDQHGTAIITLAGLINAAHLTGRNMEDIKVVANGAGAAGIACVELVKAAGIKHDNVLLCDSKGVIYQGREEGMNQWKSAHAVATDKRTLAEAMEGADVFLGISVKDALSAEMVLSMADKPIIFAMANPDPEILPEEVAKIRDDAIMATGRSDYPNQVNNVLGFPYIFRGALDVRASSINDEMKIAAAQALAELAREDVPDEVSMAYQGERLVYGPEYIIPAPFDPRLISEIPAAVAKAAMDSGVAKRPIFDLENYRNELRARLDPIAEPMQQILEEVRANPARVAFAEGEEERVMRAAVSFRNAGFGTPILVGDEDKIKKGLTNLGHGDMAGIEIASPNSGSNVEEYTEFLYQRLQRQGVLQRECERMVRVYRTVFAACMVASGDADAIITGGTRSYNDVLDDVQRVLDPAPDSLVFGLSILVARGRTIFIADTTVRERPTAEELARIAIQSADLARLMGHEPRVAMLSFSNFGNPVRERTDRIRDAVGLLDEREVSFEYDGEMTVDVALNPKLLALYPFCRLSEPANILIMPGLHSANISAQLLQEFGGGNVIGPLVVGMSKPAQIVQMGATDSDIVTLAALAAHGANR
ncbi:MAG: NADP-dependent malic enzyme [Alphaproteobacteria bacterium]|jgi:malate dehydrogenase (oxaloacetate-decarboxylating)(NADP+)|nr:NADP-dependent malic enzyme [Alphaproteobacteria bacterium]MBT4018399.1 NADP-dependent malic enzyme [Alphaproteobacteria bacterium]MBT5158420.1 NADP-dependent malic enzyme [Alphaproteobacteria bacterium]